VIGTVPAASSVLSHVFRLLIDRLGLLLVRGDKRDAEIPALRHQVLVLQRHIDHPKFTPADRTVLAVLSRAFARRGLGQVMLIVKPATVIGWHRRLVARHWTQPPQPRTGRPPTPTELRRLVLRLDLENPAWDCRRIHGEMRRLEHRIAASTVWKILRDAGREPTPNRTGPSWCEFITSQAHALVATDFFRLDAVTLRRFHALFFIEFDTRRVHLAGITTSPTGPWTTQAARNLLMAYDKAVRFVIRDGAGQYARSFDDVFAAIGGSVITIPPGAPRANAFAERWVRTVRQELLDRTLIWNHRQLHRLLEDFVAHYNEHRPHRSLGQRAPDDHPDAAVIDLGQPIQRTATCAGLINEYRPAA